MALEQAERPEAQQEWQEISPIVSPADVEAVQRASDYLGVKTTLFRDPKTSLRYVIPTALSPNPTIDRILNYSQRTNYVGIINIGMSGTGKSTWTTWLIHQLHKRKQFHIHWRYRDDIKNLDKDIDTLERGMNHIVIYDDASFVLDEMKKEEVTHIAKRLTYIRHDVGGTVIVIMNIHYGSAIKKFFRNVPFKFLTSITMDEVFSLQDVYKYGKYKFLAFAKYFQQMMFTGRWVFEIDKWNKKLLPYKTDEPFRLGLALEGNYVHFFMYLQDSCAVCDPKFDKKKALDLAQVYEILKGKYGEERARAELKRYAFMQHGIKCLNTVQLAIHRQLAQLDRANHMDWEKGIKEIESAQTRKRKRVYHKKGEIENVVKEIEAAAKIDPELGKVVLPQTSEVIEMSDEIEADIKQGIDEQKTVEAFRESKENPETKTEKPTNTYDDINEDPNSMPYGFNDDSVTGNFEQY